MIYWITFSIAGVALMVIAFLLLRHWKEIRLLDPDSIAEERERQKRDKLLLQRLSRVKSDKVAPFKVFTKKIIVAIKTIFHAGYLKLIRMEKLYKQASSPFASISPTLKDKVKVLLDDARSLTRDMKWPEAEKRYLEVLAMDKKNFEAYKGLGSIYLKQKLYPQAQETFEYILKSKMADDFTYAALAEIAEADGDHEKAEKMLLLAVLNRPRLANRHAELASFYLARNEPEKAWGYAVKCTELDAKSAKYLEISLEAAMLRDDREEARRRYDKLRVLSDDRVKLQSLKEKLDAMSDSKDIKK